MSKARDDEHDRWAAAVYSEPLTEKQLEQASDLSAEWVENGAYDRKTGHKMSLAIIHLVHEVRRLQAEAKLCDQHHWVEAYRVAVRERDTAQEEVWCLKQIIEAVRAALPDADH